MNEIWKEYNSKYEVSNCGNVRHTTHKKILKYSYPQNGTPQVNIEGTTICVSRLVAGLFMGVRPEGCEIHHKDKNPSNNNVSNLEYIPKKNHISDYHRKHEKRFCILCNTLLTNNKTYCSKKCRIEYLTEERKCVVCGKPFRISKKYLIYRFNDPRYPNGAGVYCSNACRFEGRKGAPNYKNRKDYYGLLPYQEAAIA